MTKGRTYFSTSENPRDALSAAKATYAKVVEFAARDSDVAAEMYARGQIAFALLRRDDAPAAREALSSLVTTLQQHVAGGRSDLLSVLGEIQFNRAVAAEAGAEKLAWCRQAAEAFEILVVTQGRSEFTFQLGLALWSAAHELCNSGHAREAFETFGRAREALTRAVIEHGRSEVAKELADAALREITFAPQFVDYRSVAKLARHTIPEWDRLAQVDGSQVWSYCLALTTQVLAVALTGMKEYTSALEEHDRAIHIYHSRRQVPV